MLRKLLVALAALTSLQAFAQGPAVGEIAPKPTNLQWIGATPAAFTLGRVTVIEFWATWCVPCVDAFPHMNQLVKEMKDERITFVSVTDESEEKVRGFLKKHPLDTSIALDPNGAMFRTYKVTSIPHTVIVGPDGKVAAVTRPKNVTPEVLRNIAQGKDSGLAKESEVEPSLTWDQKGEILTSDSVAQAILRPSTATSSLHYVHPKTGRIVGDGVDVKQLLLIAYGAEESPLGGSASVPPGRYRVSVKPPDQRPETARMMLRTLVDEAFPLVGKWKTVRRLAPTLHRSNGPLKLAASSAERSYGTARDGQIEGTGSSMGWLAQVLGMRASDMAALDKTGLAGKYDFKIVWTPGDRESLRKALQALGLDMVDEQREVPTFFIEPRQVKG